MTVAQDTLSGPGGTGNNGHLFSGTTTNGTTGITVASFQNPSASASLLVIGFAINDSLAAVGTLSIHWDSAGTNQNMTSIGSAEDSTAGQAIFLMGLVSPGTSGAKSVKVTWTGPAMSDSYEIFGISYTGSDTSSVAAATEGFQTNTGTTNSATVTTSAAIPSGDLEVAWFAANANPTSTNNTEIDIDLTQLSVACSSASGAGATITSTAALQASQAWVAMTVGIKAAAAAAASGAAGNPAGFVYSEW